MAVVVRQYLRSSLDFIPQYAFTTTKRAMATPQAAAASVARRYILGIETSCDDTGAAILDDEGNIISESLSSQLAVHLRNGGIIPPIARDLHKEKIHSVAWECIEKSQLDAHSLEAIAVTNRPGMPLSLLVGLHYAKDLARKLNKPLIPIHHMEAHALTIRMVEEVEFPFLVMLISGGHSLIGIAEDLDQWRTLGTTLDDAPGEALDKTARQLRLTNIPYYSEMSGGAAMEHLAQFGDRKYFEFPIVMSQMRNCDMSFAGLKWKAKKHIYEEEAKWATGPADVIPTAHHLAASFLHAISRTLGKRLERAIGFVNNRQLLDDKHRKLVVSGGVACNGTITEALGFICRRNGFSLHVPPRKLCCDNGVMIAWAGMEKLKRGIGMTWDYDGVDIDQDAPFGEDGREDVAQAGIPVGYIKFPETEVKKAPAEFWWIKSDEELESMRMEAAGESKADRAAENVSE